MNENEQQKMERVELGGTELSRHNHKGTDTPRILHDDLIDNRSKVRAYRAVPDQVIATATATKVEFNAETYDTQEEFDSTTNYRFTATKASYYQIQSIIGFESATDQCLLSVAIRKNGTAVAVSHNKASGTGYHSTVVSDILSLDTDDYIEIWVTQNSGGNVDVNADATWTFVTINRL